MLGWDGLGLRSYCLVIFYQNERSNNSGTLTVLTNRLGDSCILLRVCIIRGFGSWNFMLLPGGLLYMCLLILGCLTKRAQIPFSSWLPAAMAAPTPVSSLVHSSTLVTAGIYIIIRTSDFIYINNLGYLLSLLGALTIFISGLRANFEKDLKKVVALSTLSQLGLIVVILGLGRPELRFFHLVTHALFKSTLFIRMGVVIHNKFGDQDRRRISSFFLSSPILGICVGATNLSLLGFPFLRGFYSKDLLLETRFRRESNFILLGVLIFSTGLTARYRIRTVFLRMGQTRIGFSCYLRTDLSFLVFSRIISLFLFRLVGGFFFFWLLNIFFFINVLNFVEKFYILFVLILFFTIFYSLNIKKSNLNKNKDNISFFKSLKIMWFIHYFSTKFFSNFILLSGGKINKFYDLGWQEYWGGKGLKIFFSNSGAYLQRRQKIFNLGVFFIALVRIFF